MIGSFQSNLKTILANATEHEHLRAVTHTRQKANLLRPIFQKSCSLVESEHSNETFLKSIKPLNICTTGEFDIFGLSTKLYFLAKISIGSGRPIHFGHAAKKAIDKSSRVYGETIKQARAYSTYIRKLSVRFMQKMDCGVLAVRTITIGGGAQSIG